MMGADDTNRLTEQQFWEQYWKNLRLPCVVDHDFSFDRCLSTRLLQRLDEVLLGTQGATGGQRKFVLEIGAAPGKWLSIFPQDVYAVSGIEYSTQGMAALRRNMQMLSIEPLELIEGDFFAINPRPTYDIVMSLGFVEHFKDPLGVIARHVGWLRPGGTLVIGVPNFTGMHGFFQRLLDLSILRTHNTNVMNAGFFEALAGKLGLEKMSFEYLGSFEPALPMTYRKKSLANIVPKIILKLAGYLRRLRFFDKFNSPFISSYMLAIYRKPS